MDVGTLRLPFRGWYVMSDGEDMELKGAQPDFVIWPQPGDQPKGVDAQLAKAIEVLRDDVQAWKKQPHPELKKASGRKP
jgi:tricorn protease